MSALSPIAAFLAPGLPSGHGRRAWVVPVPRPDGQRGTGGLTRFLAGALAVWRRQRARARLAGLDAHLLRDIGVTGAEAEFEANKRFWQA